MDPGSLSLSVSVIMLCLLGAASTDGKSRALRSHAGAKTNMVL